jgi:hypothetical protein
MAITKPLTQNECIALDKKITNQINLVDDMARRLLQLDVEQNQSLKFQLDAQKKKLQEYKDQYNKNGCIVKVEEKKQETVMGVINQYTELDKARIEAETKYQTNKKVFFGAIVLILALTLIITYKKK